MKPSLTTTLVLQKLAAFLIALAAFSMVKTAYNFMLLAIVLGHSHFMLAYIYKIAARRIKARNAILFIGVALALFAYYFRIDFPDFRLESLLLITTIGAIYHTVVDDQFTLNFFSSKYSLFQRLQVLILTLTIVSLHIWWQFNNRVLSLALFGVGFLLFFYYIFQKSRAKWSWSNPEYFFLFQFFFVITVYFSGIRFYFDRMLVSSFVGIYHYFVYYFHYYSKIKSIAGKTTNSLNKLPAYLSIVAASNILFASLFFFNVSNPTFSLTLLFRYNPFLIITMMHFISSARLNEIPSLFNFKKS